MAVLFREEMKISIMKTGTDMRNNHLMLALAAIALLSCAREQVDVPETITIRAYQEGAAETRTTLIDGGTQVYWEPADEIKVFFNGVGGRFVALNTENATVATFSGSLPVVVGANEGAGVSTVTWGLYPYRSDAVQDGETLVTTLPASQTGRAGSFAKNTNITIARSEDHGLAFYNVCGGVRFSLTQEGIKRVTFEGNNGESLAGKMRMTFVEGVPAVQEVSDGESVITLTAPGGGTFETGQWYFISAIPGKLSGGYKMTFYKESESAKLTSSSSVTMKRGIFGSLADADEDLMFKPIGGGGEPQGDFIVFKDPIVKYACIEKFDTDKDGEISYKEAAAVTDISGLFADFNAVTSFDELKYFTGISNMSQAFKNLVDLKSVTIPAGVTAIEGSAFSGCTSLDSLTFDGHNVLSVGNSAFYGCVKLKDIDLPNEVERICSSAFSGCTALDGIRLPDFLNRLDSYAFQNCTSLSAIEIPSGVKLLDSSCFSGCRALRDVDLPSGMESIGSAAFENCIAIESILLPPTLKTINANAFANCSGLKSIVVPDSVTSLGYGVFSGCKALESAILPSELPTISYGLFMDCSSLYNFRLPDFVTTIDANAFSGCCFTDKATLVSKIVIPESVTAINSNAFANANNILIPSSSFVQIQLNAFSTGARIYVPDDMVDLYKARTYWSNYAGQIYPLSSYEDYPMAVAVDLGLSVKWSEFNLGATKPEEFGRYFAHGDLTGQIWNGTRWSGGGFNTKPEIDYYILDGRPIKGRYDAAVVILGSPWHMPTKDDLQELVNNCTAEWTDDYRGTGVSGMIYTSRKAGYTDKSVFFPAAGYGGGSSYNYVGTNGLYLSSTFSYTEQAWYLNFSSTSSSVSYISRSNGLSIRPVSR